MKHFFVELDDDTHRRFKTKCYEDGRTIREVVRILIKKYIDGEIKL
jgi:hypothetical protein